MKVYLEGPDNLNGIVISVIRNGEVSNVDIDLKFAEAAYRELAFKDFADQILNPAFFHLFPEVSNGTQR